MEILFYIALGWFMVTFEPLQLLLDYIFSKLPLNSFTIYIHAAFGCPKCVGFWSTWLISGQFLVACLVSLSTYAIDLCLQKLKN